MSSPLIAVLRMTYCCPNAHDLELTSLKKSTGLFSTLHVLGLFYEIKRTAASLPFSYQEGAQLIEDKHSKLHYIEKNLKY